MMYTYFILSFMWLGYFALHSLLASTTWKNWLQTKMRVSARAYRLFYVLVSVILLLPVLWYTAVHQEEKIFAVSGWSRFLGLVMATYGIFIIREAFREYHTAAFLGLANPDLESVRLVREGLNRYVRHPLYSGSLLIVVGLVVFLPTITNILVAVWVFVYTWIGIKLEEKKLSETFGKEYDQYKKEVPMLIPKLFGAKKKSPD